MDFNSYYANFFSSFKDIRSYFTAKNATSSPKNAPLKKEKLSQKRKSVTVIDSDSDDECVSSSNKRSKLNNGVGKMKRYL